jgi:hypothetical protein
MKKVVVFLTLLFLPIIVNAQTLYQDIYVKDNGDLQVKEVIKLKGEYNGFEKNINYIYNDEELYNADDIILSKICEATGTGFDMINYPTNCFTKVNTAISGDAKVYTITKYDNGYTYDLYNPSVISKNAFYLEYTLKNMIVIHNDIAELKLPILNNEFNEDLSEVIIKINLPKKDNEYKIWGHSSDLNIDGTITRTTDNMATISINDLMSNTSFDIRMTFNTDLIPNSTKFSNIDYLDEILLEESSLVNEEETGTIDKEKVFVNLDALYKIILAASTIIIVVSSIIGLIITISTWKIFKKANEPRWASIIPIYRDYVLFKISGLSGGLVFLIFVPIIGIIIYSIISIVVMFKLSKKFGLPAAFGFGLWFLPFIFYPILASNKYKYDEEEIETNDETYNNISIQNNVLPVNNQEENNVQNNVSLINNQEENNTQSNVVLPNNDIIIDKSFINNNQILNNLENNDLPKDNDSIIDLEDTIKINMQRNENNRNGY